MDWCQVFCMQFNQAELHNRDLCVKKIQIKTNASSNLIANKRSSEFNFKNAMRLDLMNSERVTFKTKV